MTPEIGDKVSEAIELIPGRIKRDEWVNQAKVLAATEEFGADKESDQSEEESRRAMELVRQGEKRRKDKEASEKALEGALKREKAEELRRNKARQRAAEWADAKQVEIEARRALLDGLGKKEREKEEVLIRISESAASIDFGIIGFIGGEENKDHLQSIKGIDAWVEEKLNALGIYKFSQIANMDSETEDAVNEAMEFRAGRVKRDEWTKQANLLVGSGR